MKRIALGNRLWAHAAGRATMHRPYLLARAIVSCSSIMIVLPASMARTRPPARCMFSMVETPTVGTSKRISCCGLATLTTVKPPRGRARRRGECLIGALDRLDGEHGPLLDRDALADVEPAHLLGQLPAEVDVLFFLGRRGARLVSIPSRTSNSGQ